jgi:hypothetical protein
MLGMEEAFRFWARRAGCGDIRAGHGLSEARGCAGVVLIGSEAGDHSPPGGHPDAGRWAVERLAELARR